MKVRRKVAVQRARNKARLIRGCGAHFGRNLGQTKRAKLGPREAKVSKEQMVFYLLSVLKTSPPHGVAWCLDHVVYFAIVNNVHCIHNSTLSCHGNSYVDYHLI